MPVIGRVTSRDGKSCRESRVSYPMCNPLLLPTYSPCHLAICAEALLSCLLFAEVGLLLFTTIIPSTSSIQSSSPPNPISPLAYTRIRRTLNSCAYLQEISTRSATRVHLNRKFPVSTSHLNCFTYNCFTCASQLLYQMP